VRELLRKLPLPLAPEAPPLDDRLPPARRLLDAVGRADEPLCLICERPYVPDNPCSLRCRACRSARRRERRRLEGDGPGAAEALRRCGDRVKLRSEALWFKTMPPAETWHVACRRKAKR
jgi:hypothetical protein